MTPQEFVSHYPLVYHMAEAGIWDSIEQHGLLSTSALLDLFEVTGQTRLEIEERQRPQSVTITHPIHGTASIRDQKPLSYVKLEQCLQGALTPNDWYRLLNGMVFFWATRERLERLLSGRAYRERRHTIITVDAAKLVGNHGHRIRLSRINSGAAMYQPTTRGRSTLRTLADWPNGVGPRNGKLKDAVAEVAVRYSVPDIRDLAIAVEET